MAKKEPETPATLATSVRLTPEMREAFEAIAADERRTLGNVLRNALEDWLNGRGRKK
jgi:predicted DNA-binding protein